MFEQAVIKYCAPTLAGLKTGSLFSYKASEDEDIETTIKVLNLILENKGLKMFSMGEKNGRTLVYVYRPDLLKRDVQEDAAHNLLRSLGYESKNLTQLLNDLTKRMVAEEEFPHEIGLFLGYPSEDVIGFIRNKGKCQKMNGRYKVYGDTESAVEKFKKYECCTECYKRHMDCGYSFCDLCVKLRGVVKENYYE